MQISYTIDAFSALTNVVNFIESKNTLGSGVRWLKKFEYFLVTSLVNPLSIKF